MQVRTMFHRVSMRSVGLFFLLSLTASRGGAEPTVTASVDRNPAIEGEGITLKITVRGGESGRPRAPESLQESFAVQSQGTSRQMTITNGVREVSLSYEYQLVPKRAGSLVVPSFVVNVDGTLVETEPIALEVRTRGAESGEEGVGDVFLTASVDRGRVVEGEEIVLTLLFGYGRQLVDRPQFDPPTFNGFVSERLPETPFATEIVNGARYTVQRIRYALFPLGTGERTISEARVTASVPRRRRRDPFGSVFGGLFDGRPVTVTSEPVTVTVDPLPPTDDPAFTGAVGEFRLKAEIDSRRVKQNDAVTLDIEISGVGNLGSPTEGAPPDVPEFRIFDASVETESPVMGDRLGAVRRIRRVYVPLVPGALEVPRVSFVYFDTKSRGYRTLSAGPFPITVEAVEGGGQNAIVPRPDEVEVRQELRFIHTGSPRGGGGGGGLAPIVIGHAVPSLALLLGWWFYRRRERDERDVVGRRVRRASNRARDRLNAGEDAWRVVAGYVADRVNADAAVPTGPEAATWLRSQGVDDALSGAVRDLAARCDAVKYAPGGNTDGNALREEARRLIDEIERFSVNPTSGVRR